MEPARFGAEKTTRAATGGNSEALGVIAAIFSCIIGGGNTAVTRYVIDTTDAVTLAGLRFGIGFLLLLPVAFLLKARWPQGRDRVATALLGILFFAVFMGLFNLALVYTSAARGALALATLPLTTMLVAASLGAERLTRRKSLGVLIAIGGVAIALLAGLHYAPAGAWRGDAIMIAATVCMTFYSIWSRPFIARSSPLGFVTAGMGAGSLTVSIVAWFGGGFDRVPSFGAAEWAAIVYLALLGAAVTFFLWVYALAHTTPTRVTNAITLNPVTAAIVATILIGEPLGFDLLFGVAAVFIGILIASTDGRHRPGDPPRRRWLGGFTGWQRGATDRKLLAHLSDEHLRDIGLSRSEAIREAMQPFWRR